MQIFGIRLVGINPENGQKLLFTIALVAGVVVLRFLLRSVARLLLCGRDELRPRFWTHQGISLFSALLLIVGFLSVWFDDPGRLASAMGLISAGLAFAMQKVVTSLAGYFVILRGRTFNVGDRIKMGGVRGDVLALGFTQTTIMEMGQPPSVQSESPGMWVKSRQFTGRVVTVSNSMIFDEPVFNYTRQFPYIWEEMSIPIQYSADRRRAEEILLEAARRHALDPGEPTASVLQEMKTYYGAEAFDFEPHVYYRLTDNWLELTARFLYNVRGTRAVKDLMAREILAAFDQAGIGIASATFEVVGLPTLRISRGKTPAA